MSIDFAALTQAVVAGVPDVRCCLVVSRDGLALGAFPAAEEAKALDVWSRVAALGEVDRGFVAVRDEVWVVCRRGPYASVAIASSTARPGVVLDQLEQMLLAAEEARLRRDGLRPEPEREPSLDAPRGLRTALHRDPAPTVERPVRVSNRSGAGAAETTEAPPVDADVAIETPPVDADVAAEAPPASEEAPADETGSGMGEDGPDRTRGDRTQGDNDQDVDRIALAREFSALLGKPGPDEGAE